MKAAYLRKEKLEAELEHPWTGNIRELENSVERAFVLSKGSVIREADLPAEMLSSPVVATTLSESETGTPAISDDASSLPQFPKRGQGGFFESADIPNSARRHEPRQRPARHRKGQLRSRHQNEGRQP